MTGVLVMPSSGTICEQATSPFGTVVTLLVGLPLIGLARALREAGDDKGEREALDGALAIVGGVVAVAVGVNVAVAVGVNVAVAVGVGLAPPQPPSVR